MQGIGVYGAEIKVGGFSGYLCELLVLGYGSFGDVLEEFAHFNRRVVLDIENYYAQRQSELPLLFSEPLVIVDPVDKGRNVASAVQPEKLYSFVAAARAFIKKPDAAFFYPPKTQALSTANLKSQLESRGSSHCVSGYRASKLLFQTSYGGNYIEPSVHCIDCWS